MNHLCSIDFESVGVYDDAAVCSFGITISRYDEKDLTFKELVDGGMYIEFDYLEQLNEMGRTKNKRTLEWWRDKTTPEARMAALGIHPGRVSLRAFPGLFRAFFADRGIDPKKVDFYDRNMFDMTKIQHIFEETLGEQVFWDYTAKFEFATALRFLGKDRYGGMRPEDFPGAIYHQPLHDAAMDHCRILKALHT